MLNSCISLKTSAIVEAKSGRRKVGGGGRVFAPNFRSTGAAKEMVDGCDATSMNGLRLMTTYPSSTSTGTRLTLTAAGPVGGCPPKQSGRWPRVQSQRAKVEGLKTNGDIPGAMTRLLLNWQILIGARWDAYLLTHCVAATARSGADK